MQQRNFILFAALMFLIFIGWTQLKMRLWPPAPVKQEEEIVETKTGWVARLFQSAADPLKKNVLNQAFVPAADRPVPPPALSADPELSVGAGENGYCLQVGFDVRGGSIRSLILKKIQKGDSYGRPVWKDGDRAKGIEPLPLIPDEENRILTSYLLYHSSDPANPSAPFLDTLGKARWEVVRDAQHHAVEETEINGKKQSKISLVTDAETTKKLGIEVTKSYTLTEHEYHIGFDLKLRNVTDFDKQFRYQFTGPRGEPIEGKWYTGKFRDALIAQVDRESKAVYRQFHDLRQTSLYSGSEKDTKAPGRLIRYAGVTIQYFAGMIVVSDEQDEQDFLDWARATLETIVVKGRVKSVSPDADQFLLTLPDGTDQVYLVHPEFARRDRPPRALWSASPTSPIPITPASTRWANRFSIAGRPRGTMPPRFSRCSSTTSPCASPPR